MTLIQVQNAMFGYGRKPVVRVDSLELQFGKCLGIFGPNGAGKTTLVRGITGLLPMMSGRVERQSGVELRLGYLPQHRAMELHWPMTGFDAAAMSISAARLFGWVRRDASAVLASMRNLGVESLKHRPFGKLSGGQQQRLLLAGALAAEPNILVLDEPTDGLDVQSRRALLDLLADCAERGLCTVVISHDVEDLLQLSDEIAWLHPAEQAGESSSCESISPEHFAERMLQTRRMR